MKNETNRIFFVDGKAYSPQNPLIIAELGTSHGGDLGKARELAAAAAEAGAACVKLQMVYADEILHPNTGEVSLPGGKIRLYDRFKQLETPLEFYRETKEYIESLGLLFLCTPFGLKSTKMLRELQPKAVKIASPELNFTALLQEIAGWRLPVLLSSGVSTLGDIEEAVSFLIPHSSFLILLHCITAYPAPETEYNLRVLKSLSAVFGVSVGVSDHSLDPVLVPALAVSQGAAVIEKHFCLSRSDPGLDDPIALPPPDFARMVKAIRRASETPSAETIAALGKEHGAAKVEAVLGDGVKMTAPSERENYSRTNRSIHALRDIHPGETITAEDFAVLRTEKILRPGLAPSFAAGICGRTARNFIPAGEGIRFEDI
jgi:sialic acid synthase SpsE